MARITLDLIRKRSEHNEGEISTLEEIALHQENIEKIELIDRTCKDLRILLLQHNLIAKIENLSRLKRLEYLNLALNNIEAIENLEGLESLKKLDLTVNFIGDLRGIDKLRCNENLEQLFLMGNPCADYDGYREYVIATLMQLKELDGTVIERSERIKALQACARIEGEIIRSYGRYKETRKAEILAHGRSQTEITEVESEDEEEENEQFWQRTSHHTPEERVAIAERWQRREERRNRENNQKNVAPTYEPKLFSAEGKPYNMNQAKVPFKLIDENHSVVLEITVYKCVRLDIIHFTRVWSRYLDTQYVDVDVQPEYVRVTIKGKILQLTLPCEVSVDNSTARRNTTNGKLVITMPRLKPLPVIKARVTNSNENLSKMKRSREMEQKLGTTMRQYLEIGPATDLDFSRIVGRRKPDREVEPSFGRRDTESTSKQEDFADDMDVPPLE
ncbi:dynein axonemal assembly factor 11-like [Hylaeus anthracinus]|uniref:dynein axonemal assembly factor 11-like n=1 Tax=Hylaeus anthracinus TaxID=313031 RepID=UPI0023B9265A|nr:dynein axonemal assembly factor 11-like [Hylaeus anthracinus]